jgi:hypothetical protein
VTPTRIRGGLAEFSRKGTQGLRGEGIVLSDIISAPEYFSQSQTLVTNLARRISIAIDMHECTVLVVSLTRLWTSDLFIVFEFRCL